MTLYFIFSSCLLGLFRGFFVAVAQSVYFVVCVVVFVKDGRLPLPSHLRTGPQRERLCC